MRSHVLGDLTSAELTGLPPGATLVIPVGATEQHGPRLPVRTDAVVSEQVALRAAAEAGPGVLVAPVLAYGSSHHHLPYPGTLSLRGRTLLAVLADLIDSAARTGFHRIVVFNGHGGNDDLIRQAARDAVLDHEITVAAASYWTLGGERLAELARAAGIHHVPGHAGAFEAALLLGLGIEPVGSPPWPQSPQGPQSPHSPGSSGSSAPPADPPPPVERAFVAEHGWVARIDGTTDPVAPATPEAGRRLLDHLVHEFAAFLTAFSARPA
ncbi:creatinine amidohydrolase [Thermocatellispora tengchongensis]|uniref:Creatinine amidohydrolase n=1 Tax=Thermocatellispora tengchongensis TaxID=1073253 RepID=A0A840NXI4_9ACTN|nr:creatininase family protein [Thermocatellispora tengchongensis]MBB5133564.1 creatinine amidohydrolase [Thermocatellispora tengchongensis]